MDHADRRPDGSANSFFQLNSFWLFGVLVVLLALPMSAPAQQGEFIPRGQPIPQSVRWQNSYSGGAGMTGSAAWTNAAGQTSHHRFPVNYPSGTLGGLVGASVRRGLPLVGWGLTLKSLIEGAGWAIDELQQQVTTTPADPQMMPSGQWVVWAERDGTLLGASSSMESFMSSGLCTAYLAKMYPGAGYSCQAVAPCSMTGPGFCRFSFNGNTNNGVVNKRQLTEWTPEYGTGSVATPIPNSQLGDLIKDHPQVVNGVSTDPDTGMPRRTAELAAAVNNLARALEAANGLPPGSIGDLNPSDDLSAPVPGQTEWPGFCDWATVVCEFIDWIKDEGPDPEKPEMPFEELDPSDITQQWSSTLGAGSCPAPYAVQILDGTFEVQWDGLCGFLDMLRPFLLAVAAFVGACIVAGVRVGKNA